MKARLVLACAVAGIAASTFGATSANAQDAFTGTIAFASDSVEPGGSVDITATCGDTEVSTFPVRSPILKPADLHRSEDGKTLSVRAPVKLDAAPGDLAGLLHVRRRTGAGLSSGQDQAGQEVAIVATCDDPNFVSSKVIYSVLTAPDLRHDPNVAGNHTLAVSGRINPDAKPGTHSLSYTCAGKKVSGKFTILGKQAQAKAAQVPVKPKGAAETGELASQPVDGGHRGIFARLHELQAGDEILVRRADGTTGRPAATGTT